MAYRKMSCGKTEIAAVLLKWQFSGGRGSINFGLNGARILLEQIFFSIIVFVSLEHNWSQLTKNIYEFVFIFAYFVCSILVLGGFNRLYYHHLSHIFVLDFTTYLYSDFAYKKCTLHLFLISNCGVQTASILACIYNSVSGSVDTTIVRCTSLDLVLQIENITKYTDNC